MHHPSLQQILERSNSAWKAQHCSMLTSHVPSCQVSTLCCVNWITSFYWKNHARFQITRPSFLTIIFSEVCPKPQILGRMFFSQVAAALLAVTLSTSCALKKDTWNCAKQCPKCIAHMFPIVPNKQVFFATDPWPITKSAPITISIILKEVELGALVKLWRCLTSKAGVHCSLETRSGCWRSDKVGEVSTLQGLVELTSLQLSPLAS